MMKLSIKSAHYCVVIALGVNSGNSWQVFLNDDEMEIYSSSTKLNCEVAWQCILFGFACSYPDQFGDACKTRFKNRI